MQRPEYDPESCTSLKILLSVWVYDMAQGHGIDVTTNGYLDAVVRQAEERGNCFPPDIADKTSLEYQATLGPHGFWEWLENGTDTDREAPYLSGPCEPELGWIEVDTREEGDRRVFFDDATAALLEQSITEWVERNHPENDGAKAVQGFFPGLRYRGGLRQDLEKHLSVCCDGIEMSQCFAGDLQGLASYLRYLLDTNHPVLDHMDREAFNPILESWGKKNDGEVDCGRNVRIFYRFRHKFSTGPGDWKYADVLVSPKEDWKEYSQEIARNLKGEYDWSNYRGVELERIEAPPLEWLREQMKQALMQAAYHTARAKEFSKLVQAAKVKPGIPVKLIKPQKELLESLTSYREMGWRFATGSHHRVVRSLLDKGLIRREVGGFRGGYVELTEAGEAALKGV